MPDLETYPADTLASADLFPSGFASRAAHLPDYIRPAKTTLAWELGPKLLEIKASYWEKRRDSLSAAILSDAGAGDLRGYFDLLATSSHFDGRLVGEGEIAYSAAGHTPAAESLPFMSRWAINGRWGKAGYGIAHRSVDHGFVSLTGAKVEHDREESQLWGEYDFGAFRLRGAGGETWETISATKTLTVTRSADAVFRVVKSNWSAQFLSRYSWVDHHEQPGDNSVSLTHGLALVYRPAPLFTIEPQVNYRQERGGFTGFKTDTPSAGLMLAYSPLRELQVIGRASYARDLSDHAAKEGSMVSATGGLHWNIGETFLGKQSLAVRFDYKDEARAALPGAHQSNFSGSVQIKIAGF